MVAADYQARPGPAAVIDPDAQFFAEHPDRQFRIRLPARELFRDKHNTELNLLKLEIKERRR